MNHLLEMEQICTKHFGRRSAQRARWYNRALMPTRISAKARVNLFRRGHVFQAIPAR